MLDEALKLILEFSRLTAYRQKTALWDIKHRDCESKDYTIGNHKFLGYILQNIREL